MQILPPHSAIITIHRSRVAVSAALGDERPARDGDPSPITRAALAAMDLAPTEYI